MRGAAAKNAFEVETLHSIELAPPFTDGIETVRRDVRAFLRDALAGYSGRRRALSWMGFDPAFSRALGARGWIGMTWPKQYGGHERSALERYVVLEEVLAAGAPVGAHWLADRQSGPLLLRYGSEAMKSALLPRMARGELAFCIGMSEPEVGSDLATVAARAERDEGGWRVSGTKLWTTFAHRSDYMIALLRTSGSPADRHRGLSQFLIDLRGPGIDIRTIRDIGSNEHFNEVVFRDAPLPEEALLGTLGEGWKQAIAELALERSGPERYLSSFQLILEAVDAAHGSQSPAVQEQLGRLYAELCTLRQMSIGVAAQLDSGRDLGLAAALVKDAGTTFEQRIPHVVHDLFGRELLAAGDALAQVQATITEAAPSFSLRGGTREVLRNIIAKELLK